MRHDALHYIVEYEISALLFLIVIITRYFSARRFPNQKNRLFSFILWATFADIITDVVSSKIIENVFLAPLAVTYSVNALYYFMTVLMTMLMTGYAVALTGYVDAKRLRTLAPLLVPGAAMVIILISNSSTRWIFYVDRQNGYVHGRLFPLIYAVSFFYLVATFVFALRYRKKLQKNEFASICRFLAVVLLSIAIQFFYPALLISGVAIALSVTLMYFTIQNPDTMLDTTTGAFTYDAMLWFLRDRMWERDRVQLIGVKINNMPLINDLMGIESGSVLLSRLNLFLKNSANDVWVFRMRGSSFVAITRKSADHRALREKLDKRIAEPWTIGNTEIILQATVCCVETENLLDDPISPEEAVGYIETAFIQSERFANRARSVTVGAELLDGIRRRRAVETALRNAIDTGVGLEIYLQPIWSVKNERFTSAEVLLRFYNAELGFIPPDEFVPIAESNGLVTAIDEMVVRKTCEFIRDNDPRAALGLDTIEVNLSALEFMHTRLPVLLNDIFEEFGVDPRILCFEITETAATQSFEPLKECMDSLVKTGCKFAIDDFGIGYANISQVIQLPFSIVKLDKSLLYGSEIVLEDMARMFARMGLRTVIEGVELLSQVELIAPLRVDYIQGYYYARPMPREEFVRFIREHLELKKPYDKTI